MNRLILHTDQPIHTQSMPPTSTTVLPFVIVADAVTPYRIHYHQRVVREFKNISLTSIFTHASSNAPWSVQPPGDINPMIVASEGAYGRSTLRSALRDWRNGGKVISVLAQNRPVAVMINGYNDAGRMRVLRWCNKQMIPVFLWGDSNIRGDMARGIKRRVKHFILTRVVRRCAAVLVCGRLGKAFFMQYGAKAEHIFYSPYEPDYELITSLPDEKIRAVAEQYNLQPDRRRIVFSARMISHKRPEMAMNAFINIAHMRPEWDLVMIGDGVMRQALQASVPDELSHRITWTGFLDDQSVVSALYRLSDVMVLPSDFEPWALVINEAAAAGLAIISSDVVGAAAELVEDGKNGRLFPAGDAAALQQCILDVTRPDVCDRMKQHSHEVLRHWRETADPVQGIIMAINHIS
jgi:glycosyltransferase involved in cell wall biosynthesis